MYRFLIRPLVWLFSLFFPVRFLRIPNTMQANNNALDNTDLRVRYLPPSSYALNPTTKQEISADDNQQSQKNQSLVLFSHGLTGTGEENSIFCTSLAKRGYVVACLHHCDGSSSRVPLPDGTCRFYEHLPSGDDYDPKDRMEQVHVRAKELLDTCSWLLGDTTAGESEGMNSDNDTNEKKDDHPIVKQIRSHLNPQKVIASGFSYGATTCSLAATLEPTRFQCAILLDGWFHVDYTSQGVEYDFPPEAFGASWPKKVTSTPDTDTTTESLKNDSNGKDKNDASTKNVDGDTSVSPSNNNIRGLNIPCLFINSSQFQGYKKLNGATHRLADLIKNNLHNSNINNEKRSAPTSEIHVIPNTKHQNFCDVVFWLPRWATRRMGKFMALGTADALEVHESILDLTVGFLKHV